MAYRWKPLVNVDTVADIEAHERMIPLRDSTLISITI